MHPEKDLGVKEPQRRNRQGLLYGVQAKIRGYEGKGVVVRSVKRAGGNARAGRVKKPPSLIKRDEKIGRVGKKGCGSHRKSPGTAKQECPRG